MIIALVFFILPIKAINAGNLTNVKDTMTRLAAAALSSHDINFVLDATTALDANETITVDFGEDNGKFSVNGAASAIGDFGFNDGTARTIVGVDGDCTGHVGVNDVAVGINDATGVVTFTACGSYTSSAAGATVDIKYGTAAGGTNRVTNPAAGNDITVAIAGSAGDIGSFAVSIIANDQVVVTATVEATFSFSLSSNTCALGILTSSGVSSCNYTITTSTNSPDGYVTTIIEDGNLRSGANDINDVADGAVTAGAEEYGIGLTGADRSFVDDEAITGTALNIALDATGPISAQLVTVAHKASITSSTLAGSYSHTVTLVSTGTF